MARPYQQQTKDQLDHIVGQLDQLGVVVGEQVAGAKAVGQELDVQIKMGNDINAHMDRAQIHVDGAVNAVKMIKPAKGALFAWIGSVLLLGLIIVLGIWWHPSKK